MHIMKFIEVLTPYVKPPCYKLVQHREFHFRFLGEKPTQLMQLGCAVTGITVGIVVGISYCHCLCTALLVTCLMPVSSYVAYILASPPPHAHHVTWAGGIYVSFEGLVFVVSTYMARVW